MIHFCVNTTCRPEGLRPGAEARSPGKGGLCGYPPSDAPRAAGADRGAHRQNRRNPATQRLDLTREPRKVARPPDIFASDFSKERKNVMKLFKNSRLLAVFVALVMCVGLSTQAFAALPELPDGPGDHEASDKDTTNNTQGGLPELPDGPGDHEASDKDTTKNPGYGSNDGDNNQGGGDGNEPETPVTPPETPETPETPDVPETPETPDTPDVPETPETPDTPDVPTAPVLPVLPPPAPEVPAATEIEDNDVPLTAEPEEEPAADPEPEAEIEDQEVPLAGLPEEVEEPQEPEPEPEETITIDDGDVPLSDVPQTGEASALVWLAVLLASGMGLVWLNTGKRKENA